MPPIMLIILPLLEKAIELEPLLASELQALFAKGVPTPADWLALKLKVTSASFESLAPNAAANLPAAPVVAATVTAPPVPLAAVETVTEAAPAVTANAPVILPAAPTVIMSAAPTA